MAIDRRQTPRRARAKPAGPVTTSARNTPSGAHHSRVQSSAFHGHVFAAQTAVSQSRGCGAKVRVRVKYPTCALNQSGCCASPTPPRRIATPSAVNGRRAARSTGATCPSRSLQRRPIRDRPPGVRNHALVLRAAPFIDQQGTPVPLGWPTGSRAQPKGRPRPPRRHQIAVILSCINDSPTTPAPAPKPAGQSAKPAEPKALRRQQPPAPARIIPRPAQAGRPIARSRQLASSFDPHGAAQNPSNRFGDHKTRRARATSRFYKKAINPVLGLETRRHFTTNPFTVTIVKITTDRPAAGNPSLLMPVPAR